MVGQSMSKLAVKSCAAFVPESTEARGPQVLLKKSDTAKGVFPI